MTRANGTVIADSSSRIESMQGGQSATPGLRPSPTPTPSRFVRSSLALTTAVVLAALAWFSLGSAAVAAAAVAVMAVLAVGVAAVRFGRFASDVRPLRLKVVNGAFDALAMRMCGPIPEALSMANGRVVGLEDLTNRAGLPQSGRMGQQQNATPWSKHLAEGGVTAAPALVFAGQYAYSYWENAHALDDNLLKAMEALSGRQVDGLADFLSLQSVKNYQLDGIKLRGHIGEQEAYDLLTDAGLDVRWPEGGATRYGPSNNPGWDLNVEGTQVNVKIVKDAGRAAQEHFADNPNIPLIINSDASNIPEDALHFDGGWPSPDDLVGSHIVIVADGLDLAGIEALADAAAGVEAPLGDEAVGSAIPGLSLAMAAARSGAREGRLLRRGDTDAKRALKNVSVDTAVNGGGAMAGGVAGAKAGLAIDAMTGGFLLGLPTAIGTFVGAVAGGTAGSKVARDIKLKPLRAAQADVQHSLKALESTSLQASRDIEKSVNLETGRQQQFTQAAAKTAQRAHTEVLHRQSSVLSAASTLTRTEAHMVLSEASRRLDVEISTMGAGERGLRGWWISRVRVKSQESRRAWLASATEHADKVEDGDVTCYFDHLMVCSTGLSYAAQFLTRYAEARQGALSATKAANDQMVADILQARCQAVARITEVRDRAAKDAEARVAASAAKVKEANTAVLREIKAAGLSTG